jgi:hypothetical protein
VLFKPDEETKAAIHLLIDTFDFDLSPAALRARCCLAFILLLLTPFQLAAEEKPKVDEPPKKLTRPDGSPDVPSDDIFGFTAPTGIGNPGDQSFISENSGGAGKRDGAYGVVTTKNSYARTMTDHFWLDIAVFGTGFRSRAVSALPGDVNTFAFDGFSGEFAYTILDRSWKNPFAITLSTEPRWARRDQVSGLKSDTFIGEMKVLIDAVIIPDKLFWGMNLNYMPTVQQSLTQPGQAVSSAGTNASMALTYEVNPSFFFGGETRYLSTFNRLNLTQRAGHALFAGPTVLVKFTEAAVLNVVWTPQVWGRAAGSQYRALDLDNYERHEFRVKLVLTF